MIRSSLTRVVVCASAAVTASVTWSATQRAHFSDLLGDATCERGVSTVTGRDAFMPTDQGPRAKRVPVFSGRLAGTILADTRFCFRMVW